MRAAILEDPVSRAAIWSGRVAWFAIFVAIIGVALARTGRIAPMQGLSVLAAAWILAVIAIIIAIIGLAVVWREGFGGASRAFLAIAIAAALLAFPTFLALKASILPAISDASSDLVDPPAFSRSRAAQEARGGPPRDQPNAEVRARQRAAYAGLAPLTIERSAEEAFALARRAAQNLGWRIVEANPPGARTGVATIEAIDVSMLLRFPDDITVRIRPLATGARIDVRSASRYGGHDFGANAQRAQRYLQEIALLNEAR